MGKTEEKKAVKEGLFAKLIAKVDKKLEEKANSSPCCCCSAGSADQSDEEKEKGNGCC